MKNKKQFSTIALSLALAPTLFALPQGEQIQNGKADITRQNNQMLIKSTDGTIINWQNFDISKNEIVKILQDSQNSSILNRVLDGQMTRIEGLLSSNANVFLINTSGIFVGGGARIDTKGFTASTLDIKNEDFINKNYKFQGNGGTIENQGIIIANGGKITLIGEAIKNSGSLKTTKNGEIFLLAGHKAVITDLKNGSIEYELEAPQGEILNLGKILTDNGEINLAGREISIKSEISANGGDINIGKRGITKSLTTTEQTLITSNSKQKNGGEVKLWADKAIYKGRYEAKSQSKNGGLVETSGLNINIDKNIKVDTSSKGGKTGEWLIDPRNITIATQNADLNLNSSGGLDTATQGTTISPETIKTGLATSNVTISTEVGSGSEAGDINVNESIIADDGNTNSLNFIYKNNLNINSGVTIDLKGGGLNANVAQGGAGNLNINRATIKVGANSTLNFSQGLNINIPTTQNQADSKNRIETRPNATLTFNSDKDNGKADIYGKLELGGNVNFKVADLELKSTQDSQDKGGAAHIVDIATTNLNIKTKNTLKFQEDSIVDLGNFASALNVERHSNNLPFRTIYLNGTTIKVGANSKMVFGDYFRINANDTQNTTIETKNGSKLIVEQDHSLSKDFGNNHQGGNDTYLPFWFNGDNTASNEWKGNLNIKGDILVRSVHTNSRISYDNALSNNTDFTLNLQKLTIDENSNFEIHKQKNLSAAGHSAITFKRANFEVKDGATLKFKGAKGGYSLKNQEKLNGWAMLFEDNINVAGSGSVDFDTTINRSGFGKASKGINFAKDNFEITAQDTATINLKTSANTATEPNFKLKDKKLTLNATNQNAKINLDITHTNQSGNQINELKLKGEGETSIKSKNSNQNTPLKISQVIKEGGGSSSITGSLVQIGDPNAPESKSIDLKNGRLKISNNGDDINAYTGSLREIYLAGKIDIAEGKTLEVSNDFTQDDKMARVKLTSNVEINNQGNFILSNRSKGVGGLELENKSLSIKGGNTLINSQSNYAPLSTEQGSINISDEAKVLINSSGLNGNEGVALNNLGALNISGGSTLDITSGKAFSQNGNEKLNDFNFVSQDLKDKINNSNGGHITLNSNINLSNDGNNKLNIAVNELKTSKDIILTNQDKTATNSLNIKTANLNTDTHTLKIDKFSTPQKLDIALGGTSGNLEVTNLDDNALNVDILGKNIDGTDKDTPAQIGGKIVAFRNDTTDTATDDSDNVAINIGSDNSKSINLTAQIQNAKDISVRANESITISTALTADNDLRITGGDITSNAVLNSKNLDITATNDINLNAETKAKENLNINATRNADINSPLSGANVNLRANDLSLDGTITSTADTTINANTANINETINSQGNLSLNATNEANINANINSNGNTTINANIANINETINSQGNLNITGENLAINKAITSQGDTTIKGTNETNINANITSQGNTNIGSQSGVTNLKDSVAINSANDLTINGSSVSSGADLTSSNGDLAINANSINLNSGSVSADDISLNATNNVTINTALTADNALNITGSDITSNAVLNSKNLDIRATNDINLNAETKAKENLNINASRNADINSPLSGANVSLRANDLSLDSTITSTANTTINANTANINETINSQGNLSLTATNEANINANINSNGNTTINAESTTINKAISSNGNLDIQANTTTINEVLNSNANLNLTADNITINKALNSQGDTTIKGTSETNINANITSQGNTNIGSQSGVTNLKDSVAINSANDLTINGSSVSSGADLSSGGSINLASLNELKFNGGSVVSKNVDIKTANGPLKFENKTNFNLLDSKDPNKKPNIIAPKDTQIIGERENLITKDTEINNAKEDAQAQADLTEITQDTKPSEILNDSLATTEPELTNSNISVEIIENGAVVETLNDEIGNRLFEIMDLGDEIVLNVANLKDSNEANENLLEPLPNQGSKILKDKE